MRIRRFIQEQLFAGPSFQIPRGYFFVRHTPILWESEYWLWPFHWLARAWYWLQERVLVVVEMVLSKALALYYGKTKTKTH